MATTQPLKSSADIQRVRDVLRTARDRALFELGIHLAFRGGDLLRFNLKHVLGKRNGDEVVIERENKTKKPRRTNLNQQCVDVLQPLIAERLTQGAGPNDPLFVSQRERTRLSIVSLSRSWKAWCDEAGLDGTYGSHSGRKSKAYIMRVEDKLPLEVLMKVLNHSSPGQTLQYACVQDDEVKKFYARSL